MVDFLFSKNSTGQSHFWADFLKRLQNWVNMLPIFTKTGQKYIQFCTKSDRIATGF